MNLYMLGNRQCVVHKPNKKITTSQHTRGMLMGPIIQWGTKETYKLNDSTQNAFFYVGQNAC